MEKLSFNVADLAKEKGNVAFKANDYATARSLYSHAMAIDQTNHLYPLNRSMANLKLERWEDAEADATKTLNISPYNLKALFRRSLAHRQLGKWGQAREDILTFLGHGGDSTQGAHELKAITDTEMSQPPHTPSISSHLDTALAKLHVKDRSPFVTIHNSAVIQKGEGVFASREFQRGDLILAEQPIFSIHSDSTRQKVETKVRNLSADHLERFLSLHNSHTECSCFPNIALGIFTTNAFALDDGDMGICLTASRFNHSCSPNASHSFNANTAELRLYALGTIPAGDEIFVTYVAGQSIYGNPRQTRQDLLLARDHFTCVCSVCSLPLAESKASDARRIKLTKLWESIGRFTSRESLHRLNAIVEGIRLLKEEGYLADADNFSNDAGVVCAYHSDWVSAKYWTHLTYQTRVAEYGENSPEVAEVHELYLDPKSFPMAGEGPPMNFINIRV